MGGCQIRLCLQLQKVHGMLKLRLCSFGSLVLLRSLANWLYRLNCHVDKKPVVGVCSSLDSGLLSMVIKVSKSHHNSTIKPLIQNSPILFQDNIALSFYCTFQSLIFSNRGQNANSYRYLVE